MEQRLSEHFTLTELTKVGPHAGVDNTPPEAFAGNAIRLAEMLERARAIWSAKLGRECLVRISYGFRCQALNDAVGGSPTSAHMLFLAADTIPDGFDIREAWDVLVADPAYCADVDQLIIERGCIHIGLPVPTHANVPRHELRLDAGPADHRSYPLYGWWTPQGVKRAGGEA